MQAECGEDYLSNEEIMGLILDTLAASKYRVTSGKFGQSSIFGQRPCFFFFE